MLTVSLGPHQRPFELWQPAMGRVFASRFAFDTETTDIDEARPYLTPTLVLATACDDTRGVFLTRDTLPAFFQAHADATFICHNAAFDLKVTQALFGASLDLYALVEQNKVWDTLILKRLLTLATEGHTARGGASLAVCAKSHLGIELDKEGHDAAGQHVRTSFGQYLGQPFTAIPQQYLHYAAADTVATWHLFWNLHGQIKQVLQNSQDVFGYVDEDWLKSVIHQFGPLTHHVQLRASIVVDVLHANGIAIDQHRQEEKARRVCELMDACKEKLRQRSFLVGQPGSAKALQSILGELKRNNPDSSLKRTASGERWSTAEEDLADLADQDPFFADYATYKAAEKLLTTYLRKMGRTRLYPRFGYLLQTGRTYCSGGFNLQNLPREKGAAADTIRGCFVPGDGKVFIDSDYSQIELVVLAYVLEHQLGLTSVLKELVNGGQDVHRLIAAQLLGKAPDQVTKEERNSIKPISFGRPGGMGVEGLRRVAKSSYGIDMTTAQVEQRINAYHRLCPELDAFLMDEIDTGFRVAAALHLTPRAYQEALGKHSSWQAPDNQQPQAWLGGMLLNVLRQRQPVTRAGQGRPYSPDEINFYWDRAQRLTDLLDLTPELTTRLRMRQADPKLWEAVRNWAGRRPVFTVTGRLRAHTTFCSSRNTLFQGAAADGTILALWLVWRAGYKLVDFVHDQLVIESPASTNTPAEVERIEELMKRGMLQVTPAMAVKVETVVTHSLNKADVAPLYTIASEPKEVVTHADIFMAA